MSDQKCWIVLINKTARGPLSEEEIRLLLSKGVIRINDIAFRVPEGDKKTSDWKFLWQFQEFDRRLNEVVNPPPKEILEKRKPVSEPEIAKKISAEIPEELNDLRIEELIPRLNTRRESGFSRQEKKSQLESQSDDLPDSLPELQMQNQGSFTKWVFPVVFALVGLTWFFTQSESPTANKKTEREVAQVPTGGTAAPSLSLGKNQKGVTSLPIARHNVPTAAPKSIHVPSLSTAAKPPPPPQLPVQKERGEISESQALHKDRDRDRNRDRDDDRDEADQDRREPADEEGTDEEEARPVAKKNQIKRPSRTGDAPSEDEEPPPEEPPAE